MKKFMVRTAAFSFCLISNAYAALPTCTPKGCVTVPSFCGGFTFGLSGTFFQPSTSQLDYALFFPDFDARDASTKTPIFEDGVYKNVEPSFDTNLKASIGYIFPCYGVGTDIFVNYTTFDHENTDNFINPNPGFFNLFATLSSGSSFDPATPLTGSNELSYFDPLFTFNNVGSVTDLSAELPITAAAAQARFTYDAWDLELGQYVNIGCRYRLRAFAGLRYVNLTHHLDARYIGSTTLTNVLVTTTTTPGRANFFINGDLNVKQRTEYQGVGPRLGVNGSYHIGNGFGLVSEASVALLAGKINSQLEDVLSFVNRGVGTSGPVSGIVEIDNTIEDEISYSYPDTTRIVPNFEGKIALDYSYAVCYFMRTKVTVEGGYLVTHYWNTIDRLTGAVVSRDPMNGNEIDEDVVSRRNIIDTSYAGPYISLQIQF